MSRKLLDEHIFALREGPVRVRKSKSALYRYIKKGARSMSGKIVFLEYCLLESGWATSIEAFQRFRRRLNDVEVKE
jgi:hypothetical protein